MNAATRAKVIAANKARATPKDACCTECPNQVYAKHLCRKHYIQQRRNVIPPLPFTVYPWEWNDPRIRSIIEAQADKSNNTRVGARKCAIAEVSVPEARKFLDTHHLQGYAHAPIRYGLRYEDQLLALMTFGAPRIQKKADPAEWELIRFCVRKGHLVPGGASRLFRHFVNHHNPRSIVSYSDIAKTSGDMYPRLGFSLVGRSAPGYVWWNGTDIRSRQSCMVHKLRVSHPELPPGMSESEIMTRLGYTKVKNLGNKVWGWRNDVQPPSLLPKR